MARVVKLSDIREELQRHIKNEVLFPIIGSGFTRGCRTKYGNNYSVPSGEDMKQDMEKYLLEHGHAELPEKSFIKVARYYEKLVSSRDFTNYIKHQFIGVKLSPGCRNFLKINWRFIYTLNLDDAIENNSRYKFKVLPNRSINLDALEKEQCVFKLHGDAEELIKYLDSRDAILGFTDYVTSLDKNRDMLEKLSRDIAFSNTLFIGCSLDNELDLLSIAQQLKEKSPGQLNRYFVTRKQPNEYQMIDLEDYGIDTIILVDDYEKFYQEFAILAEECKHVMEDELKEYHNLPCSDAPRKYMLEYLINGRYLLNKKRAVVFFPSFYVERTIESQILADMAKNKIQIIHGARVSGKTYLLAGVLRQIHNRDTYYFDSRSQVDGKMLQKLLNKKNSVLLFDTNVLLHDAMKVLLDTDYTKLEDNSINVICCINNSDREILDLVGDKMRHTDNYRSYISIYELSSYLSQGKNGVLGELESINTKLKLESQLPFIRNQTILDNLLNIQVKLRQRGNKQFVPSLELEPGDSKKLSLLILLAQNEKVTGKELLHCDLIHKSAELLQELNVAIEEDFCSLLAVNTINNVSYQIVCNAKVWLLNQLREIGRNNNLTRTVVESYQYLTHSFLGGSKNYRSVEKLVKFDKINELFPDGKRLILEIYEGLRPILNGSYQYYHQYAKCHLWGMSSQHYEKAELEAARIAAITALNIVEDEEIFRHGVLAHQEAHAHILNTLTIIYTKMCFLEDFSVQATLTETIDYFYQAIGFGENYNAMCLAKGKENRKRDEEGGVIKRWVTYILTEHPEITPACGEKVNAIVNYWNNLKAAN